VAAAAATVFVCARYPVAGRPNHRIIERPIAFGPLRRKLTLDYIRLHYDPAARDITIAPRMIVLHWTGMAQLRAALNAFEPETLAPWRRTLRAGGEVNVSAHFLVDRDGTIFQLMPEQWMARHTIGLNRVAIGIENVGGGPQEPLTTNQVDADAYLVRDLVRRHPLIEYLIGHYEYLNFRGSPLWQERLAGYETDKIDPGQEFMERARVSNLRLKGAPVPVAVDAGTGARQ
jgi:N-acetylmuramoyl-L-alanine amidase